MTIATKLKDTCFLEEKLRHDLDSILKSREINFADKGPYSQKYGFCSSHVYGCELDHKKAES